MEGGASLGAVSDLDLLGLVIIGKHIGIPADLGQSILAGVPAKLRIRMESGSPRQMMPPRIASAMPFTSPA